MVDEIFPAGNEQNQSSHTSDTRQESLLTGTVLIAADNPDNQKLIISYAEQMGLNATIAENGLVAVHKAMEGQYELLLLDMQMPVMDGFSATRILRDKGYTKAILALTENTTQEIIQQCKDAGCDDCLGKPLNQEQFNVMLAIYLSVRLGMAEKIEPILSNLLAEGHGFDELIQTFVSRLPATMETIMEAFRKLDWEELKKNIHDMKGVGGNMGYPKITHLSKDIETAVAKRDEREVSRLLDEMNRVCDQIRLGAGVL